MPWILAALRWLVGSLFTNFLALFTFQWARRLALGVALVVVFAGAFLALVVGVKAAVMAVRVAMPPILAQATYFLPSNLPVIIATAVTVRISILLFRWSMTNLQVYASHGAGYGSMIH